MEFLDKFRRKKNQIVEDVLLKEKKERRLLSVVPDPASIRGNVDRRGKHDEQKDNQKFDYEEGVKERTSGIRYECSYEIELKAGKKKYKLEASDISETGILVKTKEKSVFDDLSGKNNVKLKFQIAPGSMPEGNETKVKIKALLSRTQIKDDEFLIGYRFEKSLVEYRYKKKDRYILTASSIALFFISLCILLMRSESVIYLKFNKWLYLYSIITAIFLLSRYLFGALYRPVKVDVNFTPGVTIIIPCFNEEEWIQRTILSCINQDYPADKLEVIIVDDCSSDKSVEKIKEIVEKLSEGEADRFLVKDRISYYVQPQNAGKREALVRGVDVAKHEFVVFVDSDSFLDPYAIRHLVQPFKDPKMAGVAGRTDVANTYTNSLTKMQSVRYYIAFRIMKAAEGYFDTVTCLSGPLSCYRKEVVLKYRDRWLNQKFLGQKATFGDDRSMTNFVLSHARTGYQDTAVCSTIVPNNYKVFLKQQMRWKRSWLRESLTAGKFMWRKEPFAAFFFYIGLVVPILAPVVVIYNLVYVPIMQHIFPTTFLVGMLLMAFMMSAAQLLLRKSTTWLYGLFFCLYYEAVLLWQMPIAILTFWKSTWGTRMTEKDVEYENNKNKSFRDKIREKFGGKKNLDSQVIVESSNKLSENNNDFYETRKEVIMAQLTLKSSLFGYSKKDVAEFIEQMASDNLKKEKELNEKISKLEEEKKQLAADQVAAMQVLIEARHHADELIEQSEKEYKETIERHEAEYTEKVRKHEEEYENMVKTHEEEHAAKVSEHEAEYARMIEEYDQKVKEHDEEYEQRVKEHEAEYAKMVEEHEREFNEKTKAYEEDYERRVSRCNEAYRELRAKQESEYRKRNNQMGSSANKVKALISQIQTAVAGLSLNVLEINDIKDESDKEFAAIDNYEDIKENSLDNEELLSDDNKTGED